MKIDVELTKELIQAMQRRTKESIEIYNGVVKKMNQIANQDWDDGKKKETLEAFAELRSSMEKNINELKSYLAYLTKKVIELENRG